MKIYFCHSGNYDFRRALYQPVRKSVLNKQYEIILPHENGSVRVNSRNIIKSCDLVIAEVSFASTGMGIELGWADMFAVPVLCIYKAGSKLSGSLKEVSKDFIEYTNNEEMLAGISEYISKMNPKA